ncbi:MAG: 6,7-dimethyl-8-ribityllumazine synthase [Chitinophagaceae bacterium]
MAEIGNSRLLTSTDTGIPSKDACIVIIKTEWNAAVVDKLEAGCLSVLTEKQISQVKVVTVPGAFEIPFAVRSYWEHSKYLESRPKAFIAFGCILRGDTPHFDYVCKGVTDGIMQLNLTLPVPVIFGILTVDTQLQADQRIGGIHGHKGEEAAHTALKMMAMLDNFRERGSKKS